MATATSHHGESVNSVCNGLNAWMVKESFTALVVDPRCSCTQSTESLVSRWIGVPRSAATGNSAAHTKVYDR